MGSITASVAHVVGYGGATMCVNGQKITTNMRNNVNELELEHIRTEIRALLLSELRIQITESPTCYYGRDRDVTVSLMLISTHGEDTISQDTITIS